MAYFRYKPYSDKHNGTPYKYACCRTYKTYSQCCKTGSKLDAKHRNSKDMLRMGL